MSEIKIVRDLDNEEYHAGEGLSWSQVKQAHRSLAHYKAYIEGARLKPTDAMKRGSAVHSILEGYDAFSKQYMLNNDGLSLATKEGKALKAEAKDKGLVLLNKSDSQLCVGVAKSVSEHPLLSRILEQKNEREVSFYRKDDDTGLLLRCRTDFWLPDIKTVIDWKTTEDASANAFANSCAKFFYHGQDAFYRRVGDFEHFIFAAIEKSPPYMIGLYELNDDGISSGAVLVDRLLDEICDAQEQGNWSGYDNDVMSLNLPHWAAE